MTKTFEFIPKLVLLKEIIFVWSRIADSGPNRNNLFLIRQIRENIKMFWFCFQNDIERIVHSFLTLLLSNTQYYHRKNIVQKTNPLNNVGMY
jgi:hypothetical protein